MAYAAILGYGTVGSGVYDVIELNRSKIEKSAGEQIIVKRVLDLRDFYGEAVQSLITHDFNDILNDDEISVVAEVMGGLSPAYGYVKALLEKGKSVVTSNKELVSVHGAELMGTALANGCHFLFEASVCGGIPIIKTLYNAITADEILEISGILNGTTNFILSKMHDDGMNFQEALKEAQALGYAERNPEADISGADTARKLAIMASLATGKFVDYKDIITTGIEQVTVDDIENAEKSGCVVKLLAHCVIAGGKLAASVAPVHISKGDLFGNVNGVFNAVNIKCNALDDIFLYGRGAGKLPTGSAVVADIIESVRNKGRSSDCFWRDDKQVML